MPLSLTFLFTWDKKNVTPQSVSNKITVLACTLISGVHYMADGTWKSWFRTSYRHGKTIRVTVAGIVVAVRRRFLNANSSLNAFIKVTRFLSRHSSQGDRTSFSALVPTTSQQRSTDRPSTLSSFKSCEVKNGGTANGKTLICIPRLIIIINNVLSSVQGNPWETPWGGDEQSLSLWVEDLGCSSRSP